MHKQQIWQQTWRTHTTKRTIRTHQCDTFMRQTVSMGWYRTRTTACHTTNERRMTQRGREEERKKVGWHIWVLSTVVLAMRHKELCWAVIGCWLRANQMTVLVGDTSIHKMSTDVRYATYSTKATCWADMAGFRYFFFFFVCNKIWPLTNGFLRLGCFSFITINLCIWKIDIFADLANNKK